MRIPLLLLLALASGACEGSGVEPDPVPRRDPVVMVHGWNGSPSGFAPLTAHLRQAGWSDRDLVTFSYAATESNARVAEQLAQRVDQLLRETGAARVALVTHSMGGLSSRHYLKQLSGAARVDAWVSLAGPNHGTTLAAFCSGVQCTEMRPGSAFLTELNQGDETPGDVRYATWWSPCDEAIDPDESVALVGAQNTRTACVGHVEILGDPTVLRQVGEWIGP